MSGSDIKTDEDGIPILEDIVDPAEPESAPDAGTAEPDLLDQAVIEHLLKDESIDQLLDDMTADLQNLVTWKIEEFLKEEIHTVIHEAAQRSGPKLARDIRAQLRQALPDLLSQAVRRARGEL